MCFALVFLLATLQESVLGSTFPSTEPSPFAHFNKRPLAPAYADSQHHCITSAFNNAFSKSTTLSDNSCERYLHVMLSLFDTAESRIDRTVFNEMKRFYTDVTTLRCPTESDYFHTQVALPSPAHLSTFLTLKDNDESTQVSRSLSRVTSLVICRSTHSLGCTMI